MSNPKALDAEAENRIAEIQAAVTTAMVEIKVVAMNTRKRALDQLVADAQAHGEYDPPTKGDDA